MFEGLLQPTHVILVLVIALVVLGPKKLPEAGRSLGTGMRGFRDALRGEDDRPEVAQVAAAPVAPVAEAPAVAPAPAPPTQA
jgi:sec-independent protein translocase protein TatA